MSCSESSWPLYRATRARADRLLDELAWWWMEVVWFAAVGRTCAQLIGRLQVPGVTDSTVLFLGNDSLMLDAERALRRAANDPGKVEEYLAQFGHAVESADPIHPTLRDSSEHLAWQLAAVHRSDADPETRLARAGRQREVAEAAVRAMRGLGGFMARKALAVGRSHSAHAENAVFHFQRVLAALRATFLEAGRRLAQAGKLSQAEDVFYLERDELWTAASASTERFTAEVVEPSGVARTTQAPGTAAVHSACL